MIIERKEEIFKSTYLERNFKYTWNDKLITSIYRSVSVKQIGEWIVDRNPSEIF